MPNTCREEAERRTADKYSNANGWEHLRPTAANQRSALTTASDLGAESSHRGGSPGSSFTARVGTTLGPHGMHATEQPARRHTQRSPSIAGLTWTDAKPHFLGVKESPVQIRPSRLVVTFFRIHFYPLRASNRAIRL